MTGHLPDAQDAFADAGNMISNERLQRMIDSYGLVPDVQAALRHYKALRADTDHNAPWLGEAHALCHAMGIPSGHISDRLRALRERCELEGGYVAPIARVTICNGMAIVSSLYAPGLPDGSHDLYPACPPSSAPTKQA